MSEAVRARTPWVLWGVAMLLLVGTIALSFVNGGVGEDALFIPLAVTMILGYSTVGALLASRNPGNPIGWLMIGVGGAFVVGGFADEYVTYTYVTNLGSLPGGPVAAWVINWIYGVMLAILPLLGFLFPTGRVPGPRWRFLVPATIASGAMVVVGSMLSAGLVSDTAVPIPNPTGIRGFPGGAVAGFGWFGILGALAASIAAVIVRYRRSVGEERQQVRWLAYVAITAATVVMVGAVMSTVVGESFGNSFAGQVFAFAGFAVVGIGIPAAMGVAILKYRLYELDVVVKKTVVFVILVLLLTAVFLVGALATGGALAGSGLVEWSVAMIFIAFAIGMLITPLWRLSRRIADRVVYGGRASPYEVLTEFSGRMSDSYSTEDVLPRMAQILAGGTGAEAARVWLRVGGELRPAATWPGGDVGSALPFQRGVLPPLSDRESAFEVRHRGDLLGALSVTMPASDPMNSSKVKLVRDLASQAGLVLRNVGLIEELRASRQRIVTAQDERARKLERDIHDGAQQQLVALGVKMRLLGTLLDRDPGKAHELVDQLQTETIGALEDLRDLARGIYPPLLADKGLASALEAQGRKSAVPVSVDPDGVGRYPQDVEAAIYFCALEALNNVAKYAEASQVTVRLSHEDGRLVFSVRDDGRGFDPTVTSYGTGLQGMADRLEAIGGELVIESAPEQGTTVTGQVPTEADR